MFLSQTLSLSPPPSLSQVVDPGNDLDPGQIYDSNRHVLLAAVRKNGFKGLDIGIAPDT